VKPTIDERASSGNATLQNNRHAGFKFRVLVVDDEPSVLKTAAALLSSRGYEVLTAADGFEALVQLRQSLPDAIISDLNMRNMSGHKATFPSHSCNCNQRRLRRRCSSRVNLRCFLHQRPLHARGTFHANGRIDGAVANQTEHVETGQSPCLDSKK